MTNTKNKRGILCKLGTALTACVLAATFVLAGLFICCLPQTTAGLAQAFSGIDNPDTDFSHEQLVDAAVATRDYTVGSHSTEALKETLLRINQEANTGIDNETKLDRAPLTHTLDVEALSHLDDVYKVITLTLNVFYGLVLASVILCVILGITTGRRNIGEAFLLAGTAVIAVLLPLAGWAIIDFNGMFAVFHSLFFADGTWTFSYDSLLITMYPIAFWMGMGVVWLATTVGLSILGIIGGTLLRRRNKVQ